MKPIRFLVAVLPLLWLPGSLEVPAAHAGTAAPSYRAKDKRSRPASRRSAATLNLFQKQRLDAFLSQAPASLDTLRVLAIQVQFADSLMGGQPGAGRPEVQDSTFFAGEMKHLAQYYEGASRGRLTIEWSVTSGLYNLPEPMGYYGNDDLEDIRGVELMKSVIDSADADEDFSLYDTFMLIHAGAGQETDILDNSRVQLFSTFFDRTDIDAAFPDTTLFGLETADSVGGEPFLVDNFMLVPSTASQDGIVIGSLGIWVFEAGARLGLLPLFDSTPGGFPDSRGVGDFDVMSYGLFNAQGFIPGFPSAFNRLIAGWVDAIDVLQGGQYRLRDINNPTAADTACLRIPITESEYFLVVNRVHDTNFDSLFTFADFDSNLIPDSSDSLGGAEFDFFLTDLTNPFIVKPDPNLGGILRRFVTTGSGVYIWHVDENVVRQNLSAGFLPNDFVSRKGVDLEEADGIQDIDDVLSVFSFGSHFDSFRAGNNARFGPGTKPGSASNSFAATGVSVFDVSAADSFMTLSVQISRPYAETRTRWMGQARLQPPSAFDLDGLGADELVVLADTGRVYAFAEDGSEFIDRDSDPSTIEPYFTAAGAVWVGAPAFGDIDGGSDEEIVAASESGALYAWKGDSTEVFDGDGNAATRGVLHQGAPLAAPPMLVDVDGDLVDEVVIVERVADTLVIGFVDGSGADVMPANPQTVTLWPVKIQAQFCAPLAYGALGRPGRDTEGVVVAWADTIRSLYGLSYYPVDVRSGTGWSQEFVALTPRDGLNTGFPPVSSPSVGDLDRDGFEEAVITIPDGRMVLLAPARSFSPSSAEAIRTTPPAIRDRARIVDLKSANPSAPALGDVDGNGTLEIALFDETHFYIFENNGRLRTNWPQPIRPTGLGSHPSLVFEPPLVSPLIAGIGGGSPTVLFPTPDGTIYGYDNNGVASSGFPRAATSGLVATPTIHDLDGDDELSLITLGTVGRLETVDSVSDTILVDDETVLSIQTLPGSSAQDKRFWSMYQHDTRRHGRATEFNPLQTAGAAADPNSFIVYPNPVRGPALRARIVINQSASVDVEIYTLEGERAIGKHFIWNNTGGAIQTPFDEAIDVTALASGVYVMRMSVKSSGVSETFVKTFAILR